MTWYALYSRCRQIPVAPAVLRSAYCAQLFMTHPLNFASRQSSDTNLPMPPPLFQRAPECGLSGYLECPQPDFPKDFCCPESTRCISLDDASTALCCPSTSDCAKIQPITCDLNQQNATFSPDSAIKTTKLDVPLPECGKRCCPHGYTCTDDEKCSIDRAKANNLLPPIPSEALTISTPSATEASTGSAFPVLHDTGNESGSASITGAGVAVGIFPGIVFGILATVAVVFWLKRRALQSASSLPRNHGRKHSDGSLIASISGPMPISAQDSLRTDFVRRQTPPADDDHGSGARFMLRRTGTRVRSWFSVSRPVDPDPPPVPPLPEWYQPQAPAIHIDGNPSDEDVYMHNPQEPGNQYQHSGRSRPHSPLQLPEPTLSHPRRETTFTDMLERAGVGGFKNEQGNLFYRLSDTPEPNPRGNRL